MNRRAFFNLEGLLKSLRTEEISERGSVAKRLVSRLHCALRRPLVWNIKLHFRHPCILAHLTACFYSVYLD